jgi:hypothetical protein
MTCGALATSEPRAYATHGHGKCVLLLTRVAGRTEDRVVGARRVFDGMCLRLATRAAGAAWRAFVSESADRLAVERNIRRARPLRISTTTRFDKKKV